MVVVGQLPDVPDVGELVPHQHSQPVAHIEHIWRARVVRRAYRVEASSFENLDRAFLRAIDGNGAQRPVVMVNVAATHLVRLAVEQEPDRAVEH